MDLRQSALAQALSREEPSLIEGRADDPFLSKLFQGDNVPRQLLCSPLIAKGKIVGGLLIGPRESGEGFDADDEKALSIMSYQAALAVENARLIESNERRIAELSKLEEITEILRSPPPEPTLFSSLARSLPGLVEHDICALLLTSPEGGRLSISASLPLADGIKQELAQRMTQELDRSSQGRVHLRELEVAFFPEVPSASAPPLTTLGSVIMLPLTLRGERNGVLALARAKEEAYDLMSRKVIQIVAHLISSALDHRELGPDRREDYLSVVRALSATLEAKDSSTRDHSFYAARYAKGLALQLDLPPEEVDRIVAAALLHDIGKVGIPESIIGKPGKLTPEEYQKVQQHAVMGAKILESVDFPWDLKSLILYHHERFDGKGYPSGLRGEEIPLGARILSIAEAYEMMITGRYHPRALTPSEAAQELTRNAGTHFDPQLVSRFLDSLSEKEGN
jgi:putative nucleotidyltransferase with HDIG domain